MKKPAQERFAARILHASGDCWEWTGALAHSGTPVFTSDDGPGPAARYAWKLSRGEIPQGRRIYRMCSSSLCVNPHHWESLTREERFWRFVRKSETCWLWTGFTMKDGYGKFHAGSRGMLAHRFSYILAHGEIPAGLNVLHTCDVPGCVRPEHLFVGTTLDNSRDMVAKDRSTRGERSGTAKLTSCDVVAIRASPLDARSLSNHYRVTYQTIRDIVRRRSWKHL